MLRASVFSFGFFTKPELVLMIDCFYKNENICPWIVSVLLKQT